MRRVAVEPRMRPRWVLLHNKVVPTDTTLYCFMMGSRHFFLPKSPLRHQRALGQGSTKQIALLLGSRGGDILDHFRSKSDQRGLLCRVVRHMSSQLTRLSGDFGRKKCRDPLSGCNSTMANSSRLSRCAKPASMARCPRPITATRSLQPVATSTIWMVCPCSPVVLSPL